jgi:hypothetical protein
MTVTQRKRIPEEIQGACAVVIAAFLPDKLVLLKRSLSLVYK